MISAIGLSLVLAGAGWAGSPDEPTDACAQAGISMEREKKEFLAELARGAAGAVEIYGRRLPRNLARAGTGSDAATCWYVTTIQELQLADDLAASDVPDCAQAAAERSRAAAAARRFLALLDAKAKNSPIRPQLLSAEVRGRQVRAIKNWERCVPRGKR